MKNAKSKRGQSARPPSRTTRSGRQPHSWLAPLLRQAQWTEWEFLNILSGIPPVPPALPPQSRAEVRQAAERRHDAARHVDAAIEEGELSVRRAATGTQLAEIRKVLKDPTMMRIVESAIYAQTLYGARYTVTPVAAIRWCLSRRPLFPHCRLTKSHLKVAARELAVHSDGVIGPRWRCAQWLRAQLRSRKFTLRKLSDAGGPDPKTTNRILEGHPVSENVRDKLAAALSTRGSAVSVREIPTD